MLSRHPVRKRSARIGFSRVCKLANVRYVFMGSYPRARVQGEWSPGATPVKGGEIQISSRPVLCEGKRIWSKLWKFHSGIAAEGLWKKKRKRKKTLPASTKTFSRQYETGLPEENAPIVFCMTEHVIVSFTYNCNNDALVRVLNYLFIASCGSSERLIWISEARVTRKGWWKLSPRIKITRSDDGRELVTGTQRCINFDRFATVVCLHKRA